MDKRHTRISTFLSFVLRHGPEEIGIVLDSAGWVAIDRLLAASRAHGTTITRSELEYVVAHNDKKRFAISDDGQRIRASQGHSTDVDLGYEPTDPPEVLYHGTASCHLDTIRSEGLTKGKRHHVHMSRDEETARVVGQRHGSAVVLRVRSGEMARAGFAFFLSTNGVWLTEAVPPRYIDETGADEPV
jgi:putative RNA 2'-phosphotransferase